MASTDNGTVYDFTAGMQLDKPPVPLINGCMSQPFSAIVGGSLGGRGMNILAVFLNFCVLQTIVEMGLEPYLFC